MTEQRSEKKTAALTMHTTDERKAQIVRIADHHGITSSEWLDRTVEKELKELKDYVEFIKSVFEGD